MDIKTSFYNFPNISFLIFHITLNTIQFFIHFTLSLIFFVIVSLSSPIAIYLSSFSALSLFTQIKLATTTKIKTNQPPPPQPSVCTNHQQTYIKPSANPEQSQIKNCNLLLLPPSQITTTPN